MSNVIYGFNVINPEEPDDALVINSNDLITEKLKDIESIFIISHHVDELALPIDSELLIVKNEFGISEVSAA